MEITAFKVKSRNLSVLTFDHSNLNILNYRSPIYAKLIVLDSKLKEISTLQISSKKMSYEGDMSF